MSDDDYLFVPSLAHLREHHQPQPAPLPLGNMCSETNYSKRPRAGEPGEPLAPYQTAWQQRGQAQIAAMLQQPNDTPPLAQHPPPPPPPPAQNATQQRQLPSETVERMYAALREKHNVVQWQKDMIDRGYQNGVDPQTIAVSIRTKIREGRIWKLGNMAQQQGDRDHPIRSVRTASGLSRPGDASETIVLLVTFGNPEIK